ncbi:MAG: MBL fold metallo-hydrolase [Alphaproteobacteria bacterium]|nr:MBL fold metallo-hydrolase [Alphaproteobacteria bacterium]MBV9372528.1 MBL fold metallo-hydrolase [Alphaproteobacteria bacterium]MBV9902243.1 MBL fold metallo-hydrolase [Alphaproteobacteria bacterium]
MKRRIRPVCALACLALAAAAPPRPSFTLIEGGFEPGRQPDGNSIFLDAPRGLILVDTGRHPEHQARLLAFARASGKPVVAIVNTHWHLDHSGGDAALRAAFPAAPLYASSAVEGALAAFFPASRAEAEAYLASGRASPQEAADIRLDLARIASPAALRPSRPVAGRHVVDLGGRRIELRLARFAATEGDVWLVDRRAGLVVAGDLVVAPVPFLDTACPEGWRRALDAIAETRFRTLLPGHGAAMTRSDFLLWRRAFGRLLDCAGSLAPAAACADGWLRDAARFVPAGAEARVRGLLAYYLAARLRAAPAERARYCRPLA